jgi:hypothetical protein
VILTSYKAFAEGAELLDDEVLAAAILDRLLHHAEVLPINGPSSRLTDQLHLSRAGTMARSEGHLGISPRLDERAIHACPIRIVHVFLDNQQQVT